MLIQMIQMVQKINRNICKVYDSGYYRDTEEIESFQDS